MAARFPGTRQFGSLLAGWRGLQRFWIGLLLLLGIGAGILQVLGPVPGSVSPLTEQNGQADPVAAGHAVPDGKASESNTPGSKSHGTGPAASQDAAKAASRAAQPGRDTPGPIADPDPSLLEPYPGDGNAQLPRIATDGRTPMAAYAAGFDPTSMRPRVGILICGIGLSESDSLAAIKDLPNSVTLAVSPYAGDISRLLDRMRMSEHEYLLSIPMEPQGYPVNDPDDRHALMTSLPPAENLNRLRWVLSRITGYVGVTNAMGLMRGERLAAVPDQLGSVLEEVGHRGLLFVDGRPGQKALPSAWNRSVDVVIDDDPVDSGELDKRLDQLTHAALDKGSALGIVRVPRPVTLARVAAWTTTLAAKGLTLAPVSALVLPPAKQEVRN